MNACVGLAERRKVGKQGAVNLEIRRVQEKIERPRYTVCQDERRAKQEVIERTIIVESSWNRTRLPVHFTQQTQNIFDGEHRRILDTALGILAEKLSSASTTLQKVVKQNNGNKGLGLFEFPLKIRRNKWLLEKKSLNAVIQELEDW